MNFNWWNKKYNWKLPQQIRSSRRKDFNTWNQFNKLTVKCKAIKTIKKNEGSLWDLRDVVKWPNTCRAGIPEHEEKGKVIENLSHKIIGESYPNYQRDVNIQI
jgi:hypothetical protein